MADELSTRIRAARNEAGFTLERMASKLGVSLRTLTRWESGATPGISVKSLQAIARVTGKPLAYFFHDSVRGEGTSGHYPHVPSRTENLSEDAA